MELAGDERRLETDKGVLVSVVVETETTALLAKRSLQSTSPYDASDSATCIASDNERQVLYSSNDSAVLKNEICPLAKKRCGVTFMVLVILATVAIIAAVAKQTSRLNDVDVPDISTPLWGASPLVLAPDVVSLNGTPTFQQLASDMVPAWYNQTVHQLLVLTPQVQPGDVYKARKVILKTRDLLDVFSSTYPTTFKGFDLWEEIRHYVSHLYMSIGEFQDLHNAHVRYTKQEMEEKRSIALQWNNEFAQFRQEHPEIDKYLAAPTNLQYTHKESHLFWMGVQELPSGCDPATPSLQKLGEKQLKNALYYLHECLPFQVIMNETAHAIYHNLRKEFRSITDEFDLFQWVMFPSAPDCCKWTDTVAAVNVLKKARTLLDDINDDWTAYFIYVENDEYHKEQQRLAKRIESGWSGFKGWVKDVDLAGVLEYLGEVMRVNRTTSVGEKTPEAQSGGRNNNTLATPNEIIRLSLFDYLRARKEQPTRQLVIGNAAGDADTIISAITLAYIESTQEQQPKTPIVSIPEADLATQRPDVSLLLKLAGISDPTQVLIFVDSPLLEDGTVGDQLTLVDHNALEERFEEKNWTVVEIVDHHEDQRQYLNTCSGEARNIAFAKGQALVASACTLVAERLKRDWTPPYPASVGLLLLGVILLDSVNLSSEVGKVTQRDIDAVADLLMQTDWDALPTESREALKMFSSSDVLPDLSSLFNILQDAKYDYHFWNSLTVRDSLRLDYKEYYYHNETKVFGISTVLMPMDNFFSKKHLIRGTFDYMEEVGIDFLSIMFAFEDRRGRLHRQLAICGVSTTPMNDIASFLLRNDHSEGSLDLKEVRKKSNLSDDLQIRYFKQRNVGPSRKQIGPILLDFFESTNKSVGDAVG